MQFTHTLGVKTHGNSEELQAFPFTGYVPCSIEQQSATSMPLPDQPFPILFTEL
jgi:hypothetical protein